MPRSCLDLTGLSQNSFTRISIHDLAATEAVAMDLEYQNAFRHDNFALHQYEDPGWKNNVSDWNLQPASKLASGLAFLDLQLRGLYPALTCTSSSPCPQLDV